MFDRQGEMCAYLTGAGVLYTRRGEPLALVQDEQVLSANGQHLGWFDGAFLRDGDGLILAFVKGAKPESGLTLPPCQPFRDKPQPQPLAFKPLLVPRERPAFHWAWSEKSLTGFGPAWA